MQSGAHGRASSLSGATGLPHVWHSPNAPVSTRRRALSISAQMPLLALAELLAALALGDLRGSRGLSAVGNPRMLDLLREFESEALSLALERASGVLDRFEFMPRIVRCWLEGAWAFRHILDGGVDRAARWHAARRSNRLPGRSGRRS